MKKTFKQRMLNKSIDQCINVLGSSEATERQKEVALMILNKCYQRSDVPVQIDSFGETGLEGAVNGKSNS